MRFPDPGIGGETYLERNNNSLMAPEQSGAFLRLRKKCPRCVCAVGFFCRDMI